MTPQEKDLTTILLDRLNEIEGQPRDPEAETLIRDTTAERTDAPYSLVQTVLIQDLSLHQAQQRIADLEKQLADARGQIAAISKAKAPPPPSDQEQILQMLAPVLRSSNDGRP